MIITVTLVLALVAFGMTIASSLGKCPLWIPVLLLCIIFMLGVLPR